MMVLGYFNCIACPEEKKNDSPVLLKDIEELKNIFLKTHLSDLRNYSHFFTWLDKQILIKRIHCKLDRVLINPFWIDRFPHSHAEFLSPGLSDHSPSILNVFTGPKVKPLFRFCNFWCEDEGFLNLVCSLWYSTPPCNTLVDFHRKLHLLKAALKRNFSTKSSLLG
eukprot:TRINITY_DN23707_c0_g2_i1.p1 TRINITY_DN23707_c0_g2~~TRINITY_DN23707_c0_g2_i1.p1  ORF type:complete len:166 (-),score=8.95 TRINITY_DN23707_c0_g2_i1:66-563(-)